LDERTLEQICQIHALGTPALSPERVFGGLIHRMYRLRTERGEYALKLLSRDALAAPDARERFRRGERIAAAVAAAGLPAVAALEAAGDVLHEWGPMAALVYPWVNGRPLAPNAAGPGHAEQIGQLLGRIHRLPYRFSVGPASPMTSFSDGQWRVLIREAEAAGCSWTADLRDSLPDLSRWSGAQAEAQQALDRRWVVSHADLHQQNVLWSDAYTPWLIDWESAGLQQPAKEAVVTALEWSGFVEGEPDLAAFRVFLQAYRAEAPLSSEEIALGLRACFGNWLGWLHFCAWRSLRGADPHEREEAAGQVVGTLATVRRAEASFPVLEKECQG
jgi:Ser/Thr protein kinase RdoA (MazF antagonist)